LNLQDDVLRFVVIKVFLVFLGDFWFVTHVGSLI
jgi:hypothetical protein